MGRSEGGGTYRSMQCSGRTASMSGGQVFRVRDSQKVARATRACGGITTRRNLTHTQTLELGVTEERRVLLAKLYEGLEFVWKEKCTQGRQRTPPPPRVKEKHHPSHRPCVMMGVTAWNHILHITNSIIRFELRYAYEQRRARTQRVIKLRRDLCRLERE